MKILHITPDYPSSYYIGGQGVFTHEIAREQEKAGHEVCILTPIRSHYTLWNDLKRYEIKESIKIYRVDTSSKGISKKDFRFFPPVITKKGLKESIKLIKEADIIHFHNFWFTGFLKPLLTLAKKYNKKCVYSPFLEEYNIAPYLEDAEIYYLMLKELSEFSKALVVWSHDELVKMCECNENIFIMTGGIRTEDFNNSKKSFADEDIILSVGNVCPRKNFSALVDVLANVKNEFKAYIIGGVVVGEYMKECEKKVRDYGLEDKIIFTGTKDKAEIISMLSKSKVFVLLSTSESFGLSIIEAMASATPIVISKNCLVAESVIDGVDGFIVDAAKIHDISAKIDLLLSDEDLANRMSTLGREKALNKYSWKNTAISCLELYENIIDGVGITKNVSELDCKRLTSYVKMGTEERGLGGGWYELVQDNFSSWRGSREKAYLILKVPDGNKHKISLKAATIKDNQTLILDANGIHYTLKLEPHTWKDYSILINGLKTKVLKLNFYVENSFWEPNGRRKLGFMLSSCSISTVTPDSTLLSIMRCPFCYSKMNLKLEERNNNTIWNGNLECTNCSSSFPIKDGIFYLTAIDHSWLPKLRELLSRRERVEREISKKIETDIKQALQEQKKLSVQCIDQPFHDFFEKIELAGGEIVLDIGAGLCDTSTAFARKGCQVIALDIEPGGLKEVATKNFNDNIFFYRVVSDGERLPFEDNSFDIVFCRASVHHSTDLNTILKEMSRICKISGKVIVFSEPMISTFDDETDMLRGIIDFEEGFNKHQYTITDYKNAFLNAGLNDLEYFGHDLVLSPYINRITEKNLRGWFNRLMLKSLTHRLLSEKEFAYLFMQGSISIFSTKKREFSINKRHIKKEDQIADISLISTLVENDNSVNVVKLRDCIRKNQDKNSLKSMIIIGENDEQLSTGWRDLEFFGDCYARWTQRTAYCYLRKHPHASTLLVVEIAAHPQVTKKKIHVILELQNQCCKEFILEDDGWQRLIWDLPEVEDDVLELKIHTDDTWIPDLYSNNGDKRELGVAIRKIELRKKS